MKKARGEKIIVRKHIEWKKMKKHIKRLFALISQDSVK